MMIRFESHETKVNGLRTHYLTAGEGYPLVLLHSGEFGAGAELSWEHNIPELARHFRVVAPDWLGFGKSEKVFSFENMREFRIRHMAAFLRQIGIQEAHFVGNSMGGTMLLEMVATDPPPLPINKAVVVAGGGENSDDPARRTLNAYEGAREDMKAIFDVMFANPAIRNNEAYLERRWLASREKGAWECTAAARFRAPWATSAARSPVVYENIKSPLLMIAGGRDVLKEPGYAAEIVRRIPGAQLSMFKECGHCPHIEEPDEFNRVVVEFLTEHQ